MIDMRKQYFLLTIFFLYAGYFLNSLYRPHIYQNNIADYGIADAGNNLIFIPGVYFLLLLVRDKPIITFFYDIMLLMGLYTSFELLQFFSFVPGTFDYNDISALLLGGILTAYISNQMHRFQGSFSVSSR